MRLLLQIAPVLFLAVLFAQSDPPEKTARTILETKCAACHGACAVHLAPRRVLALPQSHSATQLVR